MTLGCRKTVWFCPGYNVGFFRWWPLKCEENRKKTEKKKKVFGIPDWVNSIMDRF